MRLYFNLLFLLASVGLIYAFPRPGYNLEKNLRNEKIKAAGAQAEPPVDERYGPFYFDQPVNHSDGSLGTFKHRYWANTDWFASGGPVILYNAGEMDAIDRAIYVTNSSMAQLAQQLQGIVIVMEHRCYGKSQIGTDYSVQYLRTLTTEQALEDMATIIRELKLPNLESELPPAPKTKWIIYGGSYSGNLAAWMRYRYPDIVFAAVPSSAPVQMKYNFYEYFNAIRTYGPEHCVRAIEQVVRYVDHILFGLFHEPKQQLKERFGVKDLAHDDDFAELLSYPLGLWQEMSPAKNPFETEFCTIFDGVDELQGYVTAYGDYITNLTQKACKDYESVNECMDTHDPRSPMYTDLKSEIRPWLWQVCTEYAYWQTAEPFWRPSVVSRKLTTQWYQRQCPLLFGEHNVPFRPEWRQINAEYKGWDINIDRAFFIDGEWDPWRMLSVQSNNAPTPRSSKNGTYYVVLPKSVHHWDFFVSDYVGPEVKKVQEDLYNAISQWIAEADGNADVDHHNSFNYQKLAS